MTTFRVRPTIRCTPIVQIALGLAVLLLSAHPATAALTPPASVTAVALSTSQIDISWTASPTKVQGHIVERSLEPGTGFVTIATTTNKVRIYRDSGLMAGTTYYYRVRGAGRKGAASAPSQVVSATTQGGGNVPPVASAGPDQNGTVGVGLQFSSAGSSDPDGTIVAYQWTFGDGGAAWGATVSHAYTAAGSYTVTLTVTDNGGLQRNDTATATITGGATGAYQWSRTFGGPQFLDSASVLDSAVSGNDVVVAGMLSGSVNFGNAMLTSAGGNDIFVAKYRADTGAPVWARRFGTVSHENASAVAVDPAGNIAITGNILAAIDFGGGVLPPLGGSNDAFIVLLSPSGNHVWSKRIGGASNDGSTAVTFDSAGNVVVTGTFLESASFGGSALTSAGSQDVFIAWYAGDNGAHLASKRAGSTGNDRPEALAAMPGGDVVLTGEFENNINFGTTNLRSAGLGDAFVARLRLAAPAILEVWAKRYGAGDYDYGMAVAADSSGGVIVAGLFKGSVNFGGGTLVNSGAHDIFLLRLSAAGGYSWSRQFGTGTSLFIGPDDVTADSAGNVLMTGTMIETVSLGGSAMPGATSQDPFVAKYSAAGVHIWSKRLVSPNGVYNRAAGIGADEAGHVIATGSFAAGTIDFGSGPVTNEGGTSPAPNSSYDGYLLNLEP
jgi:PKD repeat protein